MNESLCSQDNSVQDPSVFADLIEEWLAVQQAGQPQDVEAFVQKYPEHAGRLRQLLPAVQVLADLGNSVEKNGSFPPESADLGEPVAGVLGDYRIVREVGRGGMGVVYEAEQISLGRRVALKVLPFASTIDPRRLQRFRNEARAAASLEHPHIVPVYGVGCERGVHYYAMRFIDGRSLAELIRQQRHDAPPSGGGAPSEVEVTREYQPHDAPPSAGGAPGQPQAETASPAARTERAPRDAASFRRAAQWARQAAEALEHAHNLGVVHRDIKPANLLLDGQGKLWVADFGLAQLQTDAGLTMTGDLLGTLRYMSPEQALGKRGLVDHRTDVYSLGVTLYELLTLQPPFPGEDRQELLRQITSEELPPPHHRNPAVPVDLETVVLKATAREPADRYATAQELADDLGRFLERKPVQARLPTLLQRAYRWAGRHHTAVAAGLAALLLAVLLLSAGTLLIARSEAEAVRQRRHADEQRRLAEEREQALRRRLYPADVSAAHRALQAGNRAQARDLLARYLPQEGREELRGFEWYFLWDQCRPLETRVLEGHSDSVGPVAFSPDGKLLASASDDHTARLWDVTSGRELAVLRGHTAPVRRVFFSPDGKRLATSSTDGTVRLWEAPAWRAQPPWSAPAGQTRAAEFFPNGTMFGFVVRDDRVFELWDVKAGLKREFRHDWPGARFHSGAVSPDGKRLVLGDHSGRLSLWDLDRLWEDDRTQRLLDSVNLFAPVDGVAFTPDGKRLVAVNSRGAVHLLSLEPFCEQGSLSGHEGGLKAVAVSPDGRTAASGGYDTSIRLWDIPTRTLRTVIGSDHEVWSLAFSPDGSMLASGSGDHRVRLHTLPPGPRQERLYGRPPSIDSLRVSPDGRTLATASGWPEGAPLLWDRRTGRPCGDGRPRPALVADYWTTVAYSPDSRTVAVPTREGVVLWDVATAQPRMAPLTGRCQTFSRDGRTVITGGEDGVIRLWEAETGAPRGRFGGPQPGVTGVAQGPDGRTLATGHSDGQVCLWNQEAGRRQDVRPARHRGAVTRLTFSADGRLLVTASQSDATIHVWDVGRNEPRLSFPARSYVKDLGLSPDGRTLAVASSVGVSLFHVATGQELFALERQPMADASVNFLPDGEALLTGIAGGGELITWHAPRGP